MTRERNRTENADGAQRRASRLGRVLAITSGVVVALAVVLVLFALREIERGRDSLLASDAAFHRNDLPLAIREARSAGLAFVPGAEHVRRAEERLEAIARGAEAEGKVELARSAWDALRLVAAETDYPGRGDSEAGLRAEEALERLDRAASP